VTGTAPLSWSTHDSYEYNEYVMGADASIDIGHTRIRAEGVVRRLKYTTGKHELLSQVLAPYGQAPSKWEHTVYLLAAQQLPGRLDAFEPYLWAETLQSPTYIGDGVFVGAVGLNIHFNSAITWKNQYAHINFFDWLYKSQFSNANNDVNQFYSRLVMAF
jgi:hypothetical protein